MGTAVIPKMENTAAAAQKISVVDHVNGFHYSPEKPDNFVIDMEEFSSKESYANSRITLQRNPSRKGSGEKRSSHSNGSAAKEKDSSVVAVSAPRAGEEGGCTPEKSTVGTAVNQTGHHHHQITVTSSAGSIKAIAAADGRCTPRRNSFKRSQNSWLLDPRKVLFFFATVSSIGTLLLICFTLAIPGLQSDDVAVLE